MNLAFILTIISIFKSTVGVGAQELKNHAVLDKKGIYHIFWTVHGEDITIKLEVANKGYIGFGLSPNGGMAGSDVIIAWVLPNGTAFFHDRHAIDKIEPLIDKESNYQLLNAYENATHTVITFTRKLNTCDKDDNPIIDSTMRVIFSWHPADPKNITGLPYHGPDNRGSRQIYFISPQPAPVEITDDIFVWDVQMPNISVPPQLTAYFCVSVKLPKLAVPHYYTGYTVHVTPGNENLVHHFDLYICRGNLTYLEKQYQKNINGYQCAVSGAVADPLECQPAIIIWVFGAQGQFLPKDVGIPFGEEYGGPSYFLIQMHYNNLERKSGIVDSSILRLYLTKKPVEKRGAMLTMYANFDYSLIVPPQQPAFPTTVYCPSECTAKAYPPEGITVFAVGLHTHYAGRKLRVRHFRNNKELKPIAADDQFDFDYQEVRQLAEVVIVLPGDLLLGVCVFSTMNRNDTVVGGYGTDEEMCFFYLFYYPEVPLTICVGGPNYQEIYEYFGVEEVSSDLVHIIKPASLKDKSFFVHARNYNWSTVDEAKLNKMKKMQFEAKKNFSCFGDPKIPEQSTVIMIEYPSNATFYKEPEDECTSAIAKSTQKPKTYPQNPETYEEKPQTYEEKPQTYEEKPETYEEKPEPYQQNPKTYEEKPEPYQQSPKTYPEKPKDYHKEPKPTTQKDYY